MRIVERQVEVHGMKAIGRRSGTKWSRHFLTIAIGFVFLSLYKRIVLPQFPGLDTRYFEAMVAAAICVVTSRVISRWEPSR